MKLNRQIPAFPLGTFVVNISGTMILGIAFLLQHAPLASSGLGGGSYAGCQILQGVMDGFCGCLTTVSTWILDLSDTRRCHAYIYGSATVAVAFALLVVEIGSLKWSRGSAAPACF
jgi:fluoride ion exporter CrcB/FEX